MTASSLELWRLNIRQQHEDMYVRMLGKRDVILPKPDDPDRMPPSSKNGPL
jgi:hypothetical protein